MTQRSRILFTLSGALVVAGIVVGIVLAGRSGGIDNEQYQEVLDQAGYPQNVALRHFPAELPDAASDVYIYYQARESGAYRMELWLKPSTEDYEQIVGTVAAGAVEEVRPIDESPDPRLPRIRSRDNTGDRPLPPGSRVLFAGLTDTGDNPWQSGVTYGLVSIPGERRLGYFARQW